MFLIPTRATIYADRRRGDRRAHARSGREQDEGAGRQQDQAEDRSQECQRADRHRAGARSDQGVYAEQLTAKFGVAAVVDNKPGGGAIIAIDAVAKAPADGYTLLMTALHCNHQHVMQKI